MDEAVNPSKYLSFAPWSAMLNGMALRMAEENDQRVTKVGRFLRKTHLDELPQFINVLRGEMSMVAPVQSALKWW